jgi:hypothetical protein
MNAQKILLRKSLAKRPLDDREGQRSRIPSRWMSGNYGVRKVSGLKTDQNRVDWRDLY